MMMLAILKIENSFECDYQMEFQIEYFGCMDFKNDEFFSAHHLF